MNFTDIRTLLTQTEEQLLLGLQRHFNTTIDPDAEYLFIPNEHPLAPTSPILLVAHLDTVFKRPPRLDEITMYRSRLSCTDNKIGLGADDRCGVFALLHIYQNLEPQQRPALLFTRGEEYGGIGATCFTEDHPHLRHFYRYAIELDRQGSHDLVFYNTYNPAFEAFISQSFPAYQTAQGSFSDISILTPAFDLSAVNISIGYYHAHTPQEYINLRVLQRVIRDITHHLRRDHSLSTMYPQYEKRTTCYRLTEASSRRYYSNPGRWWYADSIYWDEPECWCDEPEYTSLRAAHHID